MTADESSLPGRALKHGWLEEIREALSSRPGMSKKAAFSLKEAERALSHSMSPWFYFDLHGLYADAGEISHEAAALVACHLFVEAHTDGFVPSSPNRSGPVLECDAGGGVRIPAWVLAHISELASNFVSGRRYSLQEAARLAGGQRGLAMILKPVLDFEMLQRAALLRAIQVLGGVRPSDRFVAEELALYGQTLSAKDRKTIGLEDRNTLARVRRARRILKPLGYDVPPRGR